MSGYSKALSACREFYGYLGSRSCLDSDQERGYVKCIFAEFRETRTCAGLSTPKYSSMLYLLTRSGIARLKKHGKVAFVSGRKVLNMETVVDSSAAERLRRKRAKKHNTREKRSTLPHCKLEVLPQHPAVITSKKKPMHFFQYVDAAGRSLMMRISVKNELETPVRIVNYQLFSRIDFELSLEKGTLTIGNDGSMTLKKDQEFEYIITCKRSPWEVGICIDDLLIGYKIVGAKNTTVDRFTIIFDKDQLSGDSQALLAVPRKPVTAVEQICYGELILGVRPPPSQTDKLERRVKLGEYPVTQNIKDALMAGAFSEENSCNSFKKLRKLAEAEIGPHNYSDKFNLLLQLEEMQGNYDILRYAMSGVTMKRRGSLMFIKVAGLAERRPSVLRGDRIIVTHHTDDSNKMNNRDEFEGFVHVVELDEIGVGFSSKLLSRAREGNKYDVRFTFNRLPIRVYHRAVDLKVSRQIRFPRNCETLYHNIRIDKSDFKNSSIQTNPEQMQAVRNIVHGKFEPVPYIIFGPPGTGKTVTLVEGMCQIIEKYEGCSILACAPSNSACDHLTKLLLKYLRQDTVFRMHAASRSWKDVPEEVRRVSNYQDGEFYFPPKKEFENFDVVVCTLVTAGRITSARFEKGYFTHVFIDEAGQATEPECMTAIAGILSDAGQLVLAGDPMQLGPVVSSGVSKRYGLGVSFLERIMEKCKIYQRDAKTLKYDNTYITKLLKNYRSHEAILKVPNKCFYENELLYSVSWTARMELVCKWPHLPHLGFPVIFEGVGGQDSRESNSPSFFNPHEVSVLLQYVKKTFELGFSGRDIGIITPYRKQVEKIRQNLRGKDVKVGTVEEFQGQERDVIIISTVRSNTDYLSFDINHNLGFLSDPKRFNVAVTRAKMLLIVIGNPNILSLDHYWKLFLEYCIAENAYRGITYKPPDYRKQEMDRFLALFEDLTIKQ